MEEINKVMVIDDDETFLLPLRVSLKRKGIECITFTVPEEAIEYLRSNAVDLLLVDYHMEPNINGDEVVKRIREFNTDTIIYLQTAYSEELPAEEMMDKYDIQGYIDKGKGDFENMQLIKSALKHSKILKLVKEQEQRIAILNYKSAIIGNLISHLVNESKSQLFQISAMNEIIKNNTDEYADENKIIRNATDEIYKLYEALNFKNQENMSVNEIFLIIKELLKVELLVNNIELVFKNEDITINITDNANEFIYLLLKVIDLYTKSNAKKVTISVSKENEEICFKFDSEITLSYNDIKELELFKDIINFKMEIQDNAFVVTI